MANLCQICGKSPITGNSISKRGKPKYLKGNGVKITGISKRRFLPNIQSFKLNNKKTKACTKCIKESKIAQITAMAISWDQN